MRRGRSTALTLDHRQSTVILGTRGLHVTRKCLAMLSLLAVARVAERQGGCCWVTVSQIGDLAAWRGRRSEASLRSQIRREIKTLDAAGFPIIEARGEQRLRGPFRLAVDASASARDYTLAGLPLPRHERSASDLLRWLDDSRWTWLGAWAFDKPDYVMDDAAATRIPPLSAGAAVRALAYITRARGAREQGRFGDALHDLRRASSVADREPDVLLRTRLKGTCHLQVGWTEYRRQRHELVDEAVGRALDALEGHGHLVLRGQILVLSALQHTRRGQFDEAVHCYWKAAEYWSVETDLYNLFSVYHNLSRLLVALADAEPESDKAHKHLHDAIAATEKSQRFCDAYKVGQNSVISIVQLANLYSRVGDYGKAMQTADRAFERASDIGNRVDIELAHWQRVRARLAAGNLYDADRIQKSYVRSLPADLRASAVARYPQVVAAVRGQRSRVPSR